MDSIGLVGAVGPTPKLWLDVWGAADDFVGYVRLPRCVKYIATFSCSTADWFETF